MSSTELDGDLWTIPGAATRPNWITSSRCRRAARELIGAGTQQAKQERAFRFLDNRRRESVQRISKAKAELDKAIAEIRREGWPRRRWKIVRLHDLRRTARSLMSRAKVPTDHAERALWSRHGRGARDLRPTRIS